MSRFRRWLPTDWRSVVITLLGGFAFGELFKWLGRGVLEHIFFGSITDLLRRGLELMLSAGAAEAIASFVIPYIAGFAIVAIPVVWAYNRGRGTRMTFGVFLMVASALSFLLGLVIHLSSMNRTAQDNQLAAQSLPTSISAPLSEETAVVLPPAGSATTEAQSVEEPRPTRILADGRIVVGVTPQYLMNLYETNTSANADRLTEQYVGNWIEVDGRFGDVTSPYSDQTVLVTFSSSEIGRFVWMYFDAGRWQRYLALLVKDQKLVVRGRIVKIRSLGLELNECEFIDPETREVIEGVAQ